MFLIWLLSEVQKLDYGTDLLCHHAKIIGGHRASQAALDKKCDVFYVRLFLVMLSNYEVCENRNAIKLCNSQNNYGVPLHMGKFV